jgi:molybdopterin-guanine dinucleotide biosynthesis protein A
MGGPGFDTVILAGGLAVRMGGADKPALEVGGRPMVVSVAAAAAAAGTARLVVVGPRRDGPVDELLESVGGTVPGGLVWRRESPPGAGPVAALRCGIGAVSAGWLALLAADLPFLTGSWIRELLAGGTSAGRAGAVLVDDDGQPQWLAGCWDTARVAAALAGYDGRTLRGLLGPLDPVLVTAPSGRGSVVSTGFGSARPPWQDCDDPVELAAARAVAERATPIGEQ